MKVYLVFVLILSFTNLTKSLTCQAMGEYGVTIECVKTDEDFLSYITIINRVEDTVEYTLEKFYSSDCNPPREMYVRYVRRLQRAGLTAFILEETPTGACRYMVMSECKVQETLFPCKEVMQMAPQ